MKRESRLPRIGWDQVGALALTEAVERKKGKDAVKLEIPLSENEHRYLLEANSHDKKLRSLVSFAKDCLLAGLHQQAAKDLGQRKVRLLPWSALATNGGNHERFGSCHDCTRCSTRGGS
jgi:hypothetical protein